MARSRDFCFKTMYVCFCVYNRLYVTFSILFVVCHPLEKLFPMNPPYPSVITAFEPPLPLGISNDLPWGGGGGWVWIFSGTTQCERWNVHMRMRQRKCMSPLHDQQQRSFWNSKCNVISEDISNSWSKYRQDVPDLRYTKNNSLLNLHFSPHKRRTWSRPGATFNTDLCDLENVPWLSSLLLKITNTKFLTWNMIWKKKIRQSVFSFLRLESQ